MASGAPVPAAGDVVGTVAGLWRYPVKSLGGEAVERLELAPGGALGDRVLAVVDTDAGKVLTAKRWPELLRAAARTERDGVVLTLPDGSEVAAGDPAVHDRLSAWLDRPVRLLPPPTEGAIPFELHAGLSDPDTPVIDFPGPAGTWLDLADAHWLTTASLAAAAGLDDAGAGAGDWDVRRFRPTALLDVDGDGWVEDGWGEVGIGGVDSEVLMATPRCTLPPRAQPGLPARPDLARVLRDGHANTLGVYARIVTPGTVALGDPVRVRRAPATA